MHDVVIKGGTVVSPEQGIFEADIGIDGELITTVSTAGDIDGERAIDATGRHVFPGVIDPHTHFGLFRPLADDADTESRSGLVGGVTTTGNIFRRGKSYPAIMDDFFKTAESNYRHDYFFTLGLLSHAHATEIDEVIDEFGITSFKWYMNYKLQAAERFGLEQNLLDDVADHFISELAAVDEPTTLAYHAENAEITAHLTEQLQDAGRDGYDAIVERFPGYAEAQSLVAGASHTRQHGYDDDFYAVHVSAKETAEELARLQSMGYGVTGETCTHYLCLTSEECDDRMKINPPIRSQADQDALWEHLAGGTLSIVGTDHIANKRANKVGEDIWESMWGSPSTATLFPLVLSEGLHEDRLGLRRVAAVTSTNAAKAYDIYPKKGSLRPGTDADIVVADIEETKTVTPELLQSSADYTMYTGREVTGWPTQTLVRGRIAYENGEVTAPPGHGTHIDRPIVAGDERDG
ncbi:dihydroorotase [Haloarcula montana]|uniref:dihydroorotase n=1 Tax=Haloarcula montana TaxID=3111776 RepID=UPI002D7920A2|nr:amidohydrolase family protein [Haloarcula sp. GH36]